MTQQHLAQLVACPPGEKHRDAREHAHLLQFALTEIVSTLRACLTMLDSRYPDSILSGRDENW
jgi:hypothetical protein